MKICPACSREFGAELGFCPHDGSALRGSRTEDGFLSQIIAERYYILKRLGEGGMGEVYLAEHVKMGRRCAIKILNRSLNQDPGAASRFGREAAHASSISHPNVVSTFDFGETEDGLLYIAMEYVDGESLAALIRREGALPPLRAVGIARQIAEGLAAAHRMGIIHRDLKPLNILIGRAFDGGDLVKLVDFGVAKALRSTEAQLTRTGFVLGTPDYMSPEQLIADPVDARSDIYSLGCCLYEMLVGEKVFAEAGEMGFSRRLTDAPPRPSRQNRQVSRSLDEVVVRALARAPQDRFQTVEEFRDALAAAVQHSGGFASVSLFPWRKSPAGEAAAGSSFWASFARSGPRLAEAQPLPTPTDPAVVTVGAPAATSGDSESTAGTAAVARVTALLHLVRARSLVSSVAVVLLMVFLAVVAIHSRSSPTGGVTPPLPPPPAAERSAPPAGVRVAESQSPAPEPTGPAPVEVPTAPTPEHLREEPERVPPERAVTDRPERARAELPGNRAAKDRVAVPPAVPPQAQAPPAVPPQAPPAPQEPSELDIADARSGLAVARVQWKRGEYAEAFDALRSVDRALRALSTRFPQSSRLRELAGQAQQVSDSARRECEGVARVARTRGETPPQCN
jgi:hypothetical protein